MQNKAVPTPDKIWKILKEVSLSQKKLELKIQGTECKIQKIDKKIQKIEQKIKNTGPLLKESKQENDGLIKSIEDHFVTDLGELIEALIDGSLIKILNQKNIKVNSTVTDYKGRHLEGKSKEFDVIALSGNEIVVIETKSNLNQKKVDQFLEVMQAFKNHCPEYESLKVYGGMACLKGRKSTFLYAEQKGLFVIRVSGKKAVLMNKEKFQPKILA